MMLNWPLMTFHFLFMFSNGGLPPLLLLLVPERPRQLKPYPGRSINPGLGILSFALHSFTLLLFCSFALLLFRSFTLSLFSSFALLLFRSFAHFCSFALLIFCSFALSLFRSFDLLLCCSFALLLFCSSLFCSLLFRSSFFHSKLLILKSGRERIPSVTLCSVALLKERWEQFDLFHEQIGLSLTKK